MLRTSFTCNSLKFKHLFYYLWIILRYSKNSWTNFFRQELAKYFNISNEKIFLFGSGRMGLYVLLKSIYKAKDDEVIVAGYTCVVVTNAVKFAGMKAVYVDVDENTLNISTEKIKALIGRQTRAIIVTHNFGIVYEDIHVLKKEFPDIVIIEDAAHTFTSVDNSGQKAGLLGDASFFSLEYSKPLTTGMGGILVINNGKLIDPLSNAYSKLKFYPRLFNFKIFATLKIHLLSSYRCTIFIKGALVRLLKFLGLLFISPEKEMIGEMPKYYPVKLSPGLSIFGFLQLRNIENTNYLKNEIVKDYYNSLINTQSIRQIYSEKYNYVRYPIVFNNSVNRETIENIKKELLSSGIAVGEWFNDVVHPKGSYRYCYIDGTCPVGETLSKRIINLPVNINSKLNKKELNKLSVILRGNVK